jgi:putative copper export protein
LAQICAKIATTPKRRAKMPHMSVWYSLIMLLHLIAVALWLGAIVFFLVVSGPAVNELDTGIAIKTMNQGRIGLENISWTAIALLLISGIANLILRNQSAAVPPSDFYTIVLSVKLFLFGAMAMHHGLQVFKYAPRIAAMTAELPAGTLVWPEPLLSCWRRWFLLLKINAGLGPVVVLLGMALVKS